jgi:hypothetical protein
MSDKAEAPGADELHFVEARHRPGGFEFAPVVPRAVVNAERAHLGGTVGLDFERQAKCRVHPAR